MKQEIIKINSEFIRLDQFLKWAGIAGMGSDAKMMIDNGDVSVNHQSERRRGRKIYPGDIVGVVNREFIVESHPIKVLD